MFLWFIYLSHILTSVYFVVVFFVFVFFLCTLLLFYYVSAQSGPLQITDIGLLN